MTLGGSKCNFKSGGNIAQSLGGKKKGKKTLTPYMKFVKKHFPLMKVKHPNDKAPQIIKKIADEWNKQNKNK